MSGEPDCAAQYSGSPTTETVVSNNGTRANVFVYIKEGLSGAAAPSSSPVNVNQEGCRYHPHVIGLQVGQPLTYQNSDGLLHNVKANPAENRPFNMSQPNNMTSAERTFATPEIMIPVVCDVHGWMSMYIGVVDNPYFAVSDDGGSFTIRNVPPGTYTVEAWHERYGVQTMSVTVAPNGTGTADFAYSAAMAANAIVPLGTPIDLHDHAGDR
jgi:plastocyanin